MTATTTTVVLFTRDLRIHDHPALAAAAANGRVVPLFVLDAHILGGAHVAANRVSFLVESLHDLRRSLEARGATLLVRRGDAVEETMRIVEATGAAAVHLSADVTRYAKDRERRLAAACATHGVELRTFPGVTVVPAGELTPAGAGHYAVFTPYHRAWRAHPWREVAPAPREPATPPRLPTPGDIPAWQDLAGGERSPRLIAGGETEGRRRMDAWLRYGIVAYEATRDNLAEYGGSRLSVYLHLGCISPLELARRSLDAERDESFVRQLCWRDFHHQVTNAFPDIAHRDYRSHGQRWEHRPDLLARWKDGNTGVGIVDAAMRQLRAEGWMPNRARLITAAYLTRMLGVDWRDGAAHFMDWLVDGDVANNSGNWQWVAGTGNDTRPNRRFNIERQAQRFDPSGTYVRTYAPEAAMQGVLL